MAPATWVGLSKATGDARYAAYADKEFWASTDYLLDKENNLYFRDSRYLTRRDDKGRKIFWSRGNGWSYAGIVNVLKLLPADHLSRPRYVALFKAMSAELVAIQKPDGYWAPSLLAPENSPPETSGTAFFTYGLAWGVNTGVLKGRQYPEAVAKGWAALERAVTPEGKLTWVQQVGYAPEQVEPGDTQLYGAGALLLAATEVGRGRR
jgi:rhamnogalacturonyl hydrolase YesR